MVPYLAILLAGAVVGLVNGVVGGGSILSYPVLLAFGSPPVTATITNSLGVSSANIFALWANLRQAKVDLSKYRLSAYLSAVGASVGCFVLLKAPSDSFERIVPFLLLFASLTVFVPTRIRSSALNFSNNLEPFLIATSGIYCGYFGPGQGVMVLATLRRIAQRSAHEINSAKNFIIGLTSLFTSSIFLLSGRAHYLEALALFVGSALGGFIGGKWASNFSERGIKAALLTVGLGASVWLFIRAYL